MTGRIILGLVLIAIGISALTGISIFNFVIAVIFLWIGINILTGRRGDWHDRHSKNYELHTDELNEVYVFSGTEKLIVSDDFLGGKITCVFGAADFDLTEAMVADGEINLEANAVFGGIRLRVPKNWMVENRATSIIGGIDNRTKPQKGKNVILKLHGSAVFGGIEISN